MPSQLSEQIKKILNSSLLFFWLISGALFHSLVCSLVYGQSFLQLDFDTFIFVGRMAFGVAIVFWGLFFWKLKFKDEALSTGEFLVFLLASLTLLTLLSATGWDDYSYRMLAVAFFKQRGYLAAESTPWLWYNLYPKGGEAWLIVGRFVLGNEFFVNWFHIWNLGLFYIVGRTLASRTFVLWLFLCLPVASMAIMSVYNDSLVCFFTCGAILFLMRSAWLSVRLFDLLMAGLFCFLTATVKLSGWTFGAATAITWLILLILKWQPSKQAVFHKAWQIVVYFFLLIGPTLYMFYNYEFLGSWLPSSSKAIAENGQTPISLWGHLGFYDWPEDKDWRLSGKYWLDSRFSGYGLWVFPLIIFIVYNLCYRKNAKINWRDLALLLLPFFVFYLATPYKWYPLYNVSWWLLFFLAGLLFFQHLGKNQKRFVVFCQVLTAFFVIKEAIRNGNSLLTSGFEKFPAFGRPQVEKEVNAVEAQTICWLPDYIFAFNGFDRDLESRLEYRPQGNIDGCDFALCLPSSNCLQGFEQEKIVSEGEHVQLLRINSDRSK